MLDSHAPVGNFTSVIGELEAEHLRLKSDLAAASAPINVVTIHPTAIDRYLRVVDDMTAAIETGEHEQLSGSIRDLIETATVNRTEKGEALHIVVQGRLASLLETPVFPSEKMSGVKVVARDRYRFLPHDANLRFLLRSSA
jgi:hypothetical protein